METESNLNQKYRWDQEGKFKTASTLQQFNRELERNSNIIYFEPTGELYFDQNGRQPGTGDPQNSGLFAVLKGAPELSPASIELI